MVELCLRLFGYVCRKPIEALVRRVDQMEGSLITRGRGIYRKVISKTIKKDLEVSGFAMDMIYNRTL